MNPPCSNRIRSTIKCRWMCCTQSHLMPKPERERRNALNSKSYKQLSIYQKKLFYETQHTLDDVGFAWYRKKDAQKD